MLKQLTRSAIGRMKIFDRRGRTEMLEIYEYLSQESGIRFAREAFDSIGMAF